MSGMMKAPMMGGMPGGMQQDQMMSLASMLQSMTPPTGMPVPPMMPGMPQQKPQKPMGMVSSGSRSIRSGPGNNIPLFGDLMRRR